MDGYCTLSETSASLRGPIVAWNSQSWRRLENLARLASAETFNVRVMQSQAGASHEPEVTRAESIL